MRFVWMMGFALGCETKDPYADWDTGGSYTGWSNDDHADHDHDGDDGYEEGGAEQGGEEGGEEGGDDGSAAFASCQFGSDICIETDAADAAAWCDAEGGSNNVDACADGYIGSCDIPAQDDNPTYADAATAYYYNGFDGEIACEDDARGEYTVAGEGGGSDGYDTAEPEDDWDDTGATP